jgi:hypothetical protein
LCLASALKRYLDVQRRTHLPIFARWGNKDVPRVSPQYTDKWCYRQPRRSDTARLGCAVRQIVACPRKASDLRCARYAKRVELRRYFFRRGGGMRIVFMMLLFLPALSFGQTHETPRQYGARWEMHCLSKPPQERGECREQARGAVEKYSADVSAFSAEQNRRNWAGYAEKQRRREEANAAADQRRRDDARHEAILREQRRNRGL